MHTLAFILDDAIIWPEKEDILNNMPQCFKKYQKTFIVLDCTEIPIEKPNCYDCRIKVWSHYKGVETVKILFGSAPSGLIIYRSLAYGGRASDKKIFNDSDILKKLVPTRDGIMLDKGFDIENEVAEAYVKLYMPPKLAKKNNFLAKKYILLKQ